MTFRVTQNLLSNIVLRNLNSNIEKLMVTQTRLSSGKRLNKPSDDPVGTATAMRLRSRLYQTDQFLRNIDRGETQLNISDAALEDMSGLLMRAQELAIAQSNTTADYKTRKAVAQEIDGLINQFVDVLNTRVGNRYIFAGYESLEAPFLQSLNGVKYVGDSGQMAIEIESGTVMNANLAGSLLLPTSVDDLGGHANLNPYTERSVPLEQRLLTELNQGSGVDEGFIRIYNRAGQTALVNLRGARTISDVAIRISSAEDANGAIMQINAYVDEQTQGLVIEDQTTSFYWKTGQHLKVEDLGNGRTARQLGIKIEDENDTGKIIGRDLVPLPLTTRLQDLRRGSGVELGSFRITDREGNTATIDISQAETLADVRSLINEAGTNLRAEINTGGNGLIIGDSSSVNAAGNFTITDEVDENGEYLTHTARDLGILTPKNGVSGNLLIGEALDPQLTRETPVALLNRGQGFQLGLMIIENGPKTGTIDLTKASTVGYIIDAINASGLDLVAKINDLGTGIMVTSDVGGRILKISNAPGSATALNLGLEGTRDMLVERVVPLGEGSDLQIALNGETRLKNLNGGAGFNPGVIRITDGMGQSINIKLAGVNTIQGMLNLINSYGIQGDGSVNIVAEIAPDQQSIQLIDKSIRNTGILTVLETGNLLGDFSDLTSGKTVVVNAFRTNTGELVARSADIVKTTLAEEVTLSGIIETVNKDTGAISLRTPDNTLYDVRSDQSVQNLFAGQSIFLNGNFAVTGEYVARTVDVISDLIAGDEQFQGTIESANEVDKKITLLDSQGSSRQIRIITDRGQIRVADVAGGTAARDLGILGTSVVGSDRIQGWKLNPTLAETTSLSLLNGGTFIPGKIQVSNGQNTETIDLSAADTIGELLSQLNSATIGVLASINPSGKGISVQSRINGTTLMVSKIALKNPDGSKKTYSDGSTIFDNTADNLGISGSADVLGNLYYLKIALLNNNQEDVSRTLDNFPVALNRILNQRTSVGARTNQMTTTEDRGLDSKLNNTEILSGIEDVDVVKAVNDLAAEENAYNAALSAASRIILPSLLDFL